ncbi:MAG: tRNA dihydrouridine synthase DusB [Candidatus Woesearchaeota archaeon]
MKIGKVDIDSKLVLAPMEGVNCAAFRLLCREYGAGLVSTPMILTDELVKEPEKIIKRLCFLKNEKPISIQLAGSDPKIMERAVQIIEEYADIIDINLGCPKKEILALKAGAFFTKHPEQIKKIVSPIINSTNKPVTAKIRIGWDEKSINTLETVKILEDLGVDAIAIHARTRKQVYSGKAAWSEIKKAKEKANIPIIGNGDIFLPGNAKSMLEQTKCDFAMIARGAIGNPIIFGRADNLLKKGKSNSEPSEKEKKECFLKFLGYYEKYEHGRSFSEQKQQAMWFAKEMNNSGILRKKIENAANTEELKMIFNR